jgi:hypothetical protein
MTTAFTWTAWVALAGALVSCSPGRSGDDAAADSAGDTAGTPSAAGADQQTASRSETGRSDSAPGRRDVARGGGRPDAGRTDSAGRDTAAGGAARRSAGGALTGDQGADRAMLARLEREAAELAQTEGCSESASCRAAPVGAKACGGPRRYLVYCAVRTNERALLAKLEDLRRLEREFNRRYEIVSTCDFISEPQVESVGGVCRAR